MALPSPSLASRHPAFAALKAQLDNAAIAAPRVPVEQLVPTTIPALDRLLQGGIQRGTLTVLEGHAGRWSIAARLVAAVTRSATAAIVDDGGLYPPSLAEAGARLDRVLIVPARSPIAAARAADVLLRAEACRLVLVPAYDLRPAVWTRLSGLAHRTGAVAIAITPTGAPAQPALVAAASLRLHCHRERLLISGTRGLWCTFCGYDVAAEVRKCKTASGRHTSIRVSDFPVDMTRVTQCEDDTDVAVRSV